MREAFEYFQRDRNQRQGDEKSDDMTAFFDTPPDIIHGTTSYLAKAAVNHLLQGAMMHTKVTEPACKMM